MEEKQLKETMIADVMDGFDFTKVRTVMLAIDCKWSIGEGERSVPGMWQIMDMAKNLLEGVMKYYGDGQFHSMGSGGFMASLDDEGNLSLQFILEEMTVQPDDYDEI